MQRKWVVSPDYRAAIEAISAVREKLGISQRELARRMGKHPSFVNKIEQLERRLDVLEFIAIAEALALDSGKLLTEIRATLSEQIQV